MSLKHILYSEFSNTTVEVTKYDHFGTNRNWQQYQNDKIKLDTLRINSDLRYVQSGSIFITFDHSHSKQFSLYNHINITLA